jgi:hypothetical protein
MALVPPPATAIMLKKKGIYGHPEEGILQTLRDFWFGLIFGLPSFDTTEPLRCHLDTPLPLPNINPMLFCARASLSSAAIRYHRMALLLF